MRACIYGRFSMDEQSPSSIEDQFRIGDRIAARESISVVAYFEDRAISGGTHERPGYQSMLDAARRGDFEIIIVEDISRLWRSRAEFGPRSAELEDLGVHMVTAVGDDTRRDGWGLTIQIKLAMAEHARREAGYRTKRGLEGRAIAGKSAGGRAYGYLAEYESPTGERVIEPARAAIVREIFERFIEGETLRSIATDLNVRSIPSPGAHWKREERAKDGLWRVSALHALLHNEIYVGRLVWNRARWIRSAANSKKRRYVENPREEWIVHERPDLAIIDAETWELAQRRMNERAELYKPGRGGKPRYLLSGLLRCACCSAAFTIAAHRPVRYACSTRRTAGDQGCTNDLMVTRDLVERRVLETLRERFLSREGREVARRALIEAAKEEPRATDPAIARLDLQIRELERLRREGILTKEIAAPALRQAYNDREAAANRGGEVYDPVFGAQAAYAEAIGQLESVLEGEDASEAREALRQVIQSITLHPRGSILWAELKTGAWLSLVNQVGSGGTIWTELTPEKKRRA
jgi:site-specific DNA recombinase